MFPSLVYRTGFAAVACAAFILLAPAGKAEEDVWPALKQQTFGDRQIQAEDGAVVLEIPGTAEDASLVPLTVRVPPVVTQKLKSPAANQAAARTRASPSRRRRGCVRFLPAWRSRRGSGHWARRKAEHACAQSVQGPNFTRLMQQLPPARAERK
jgi:hypothetical protein